MGRSHFEAKSIQAFQRLLGGLNSKGTLDSVQMEGIEKMLKQIKALARSLNTSDDQKVKVLLDEIFQGLVQAFVRWEKDEH